MQVHVVLSAVSFSGAPVLANKIPPNMPLSMSILFIISIFFVSNIFHAVSYIKAESLKSTGNELRNPDIHVKLETNHACSLGFTAAEHTA